MNLAVGIELTVIGGLFCVKSLILMGQTVLFLRKAIPAEGTVVGHAIKRKTQDVTWFFQKVIFQDAAGKPREAVVRSAATVTIPVFGETIELLYDPANPIRVRTTRTRDLWRGFLPFCAGVASLVGGIAAFRL